MRLDMKRLAAFAAAMLLAVAVAGCSSIAGPDKNPLGGEKWSGDVTGDATGVLNLELLLFDQKGGVIPVRGSARLVGPTKAPEIKGVGRMIVEGEITDGQLSARLSGWAEIPDGSADLYGTITGKFIRNRASGAWSVSAKDNDKTYQGSWTAKRVESTP